MTDPHMCTIEPWPPSDIISPVINSSKPVINPPKSEIIKDSGKRTEFKSGAVRDISAGKGRFDLLQIHGILAAAMQLEAGAKKYSARNWEKGIPLSSFLNSALRHLFKELAGYDDEPHLPAAIWNLLSLAEGQRRIEEGIWDSSLDDLPHTYKGKTPNF